MARHLTDQAWAGRRYKRRARRVESFAGGKGCRRYLWLRALLDTALVIEAVICPAWIINNNLGPTFNHRFDYMAANLRYWFLEKMGWVGVEYLHGRRELENSTSGSANVSSSQFALIFRERVNKRMHKPLERDPSPVQPREHPPIHDRAADELAEGSRKISWR
jgi:hypothetical protein